MAIPIRHSGASRIVANDRTFFITSSVTEKRNLLQSERAAGLFICLLYGYRSQAKFRLHEFVVMPDHFHVLITVGSELSVEKAVQFIKGGFAHQAGKQLGFKAPVWQRGFSEARIRDAEAYERGREYIRNNPVARHLVIEADGYPYSSAYPGYGLDPAPQGLKPTDFMQIGRHG